MRRYESVVILNPDMPDDDIQGFTDRFSNLIKTNGGEIIKIEDWGFKKLAYLVEKKDKGRYILFDFVGMPALILELERQFKITEDVLKYLSVKLDEDVDLEAFKASVQEKAASPAEVTEVAEGAEGAGTGAEAVAESAEAGAVLASEAEAAPTAEAPSAETAPAPEALVAEAVPEPAAQSASESTESPATQPAAAETTKED